MATPRFAWGIDIGNRALKAVKLVRDGDSLRVDDFEFIEHETILSQAGDNKEALIQTALANFVQRHQTKGGVVSAGVSGQNSFARFVKLPPIEEKKIPEIVRFEAIQQIPFPLDDVEWSYQLFREEDNPEIEVGIFAMRRELVNQHIKYFTDFDLNVQTVQMNPLANYNAMQFDGRFNDGLAMVIDVGTDNTDLLIAGNESIWMRSIPLGGNNFTEALVKAFKINAARAEQEKRNAATSKYARQIFQHMRPVFADLVTDIQRSIGFYASSHSGAKITKIYVLGSTFKLPGLQKYLQQNLQMPVERIDGLAAGAPTDPKLAATFGDNLLSVVGAYGLAIQAMGGSVVNSSLLPRAIQRERVWQDKTKWFGLAAALCVAAVTVPAARLFYENLQYKSAEAKRAENAQVLQRANGLSNQWKTIQESGEAERTTIANLQTINDGKYVWPEIMQAIAAAVPQPPDDLAKALKSGDVETVRKTPRGQRQIIQIDEMSSQYDPALMPKLALPAFTLPVLPPLATEPLAALSGGTGGGAFGTAAPAADPAAAAAAPDATGKGRGFTVTLRLTCPMENAVAYMEQTLPKALAAIGPTEGMPNARFAVHKAAIASSIRVSQDANRLTKLQADYTAIQTAKTAAAATNGAPPSAAAPDGAAPAGGFGKSPVFGGPPGAAAPGAAPAAPPAAVDAVAESRKDRLTGEDVTNDWEFVVTLAVELDPPAYVKPAPDPNAPAVDPSAPAATPAAAPVTP